MSMQMHSMVHRQLDDAEDCPLCGTSSEYRPLSPHEAMNFRDCLVEVIKYYAFDIAREHQEFAKRVEAEQRLVMPEMGPGFVTAVSDMIRNASLVFWKYDLWEAAGSGADVFVNTVFDLETLVPPVQFWLPDRDYIFKNTETAYLGLPPEVCAMTGVVLARLSYLRELSALAETVKSTSGHDLMLVITLTTPLQGKGEALGIWPRLRLGYICQGTLIDEVTFGRVAAMLAFMQLPIVAVEHRVPPRAERRRLEHANQKVPEMRVITLRHIKHAASATGDKVDWSCQWIVHGFWRQQWYPSLQAHKPVYVSSYIKGPEGKPLKTSPGKTLFMVKR